MLSRNVIAALAWFLAAQSSWGAEPPCKGVEDHKVLEAAGGLIDMTTWRPCAIVSAGFGPDMPGAVAILLRSRKPQGESGTGLPLYAVDLVIANAGKKLYRFTDLANASQLFIDDELGVRNLDGHGTSAVLFHSGEVGVSDWWSAMHLVVLPAGESSAWDVAPADFGNSWRHKLRWITLKGLPAVLVAKPVSPAGLEDAHRCHSCPKFYQYFVYQWSPGRAAFLVSRVIQSARDIDADTDPLEADGKFIEAALAN